VYRVQILKITHRAVGALLVKAYDVKRDLQGADMQAVPILIF